MIFLASLIIGFAFFTESALGFGGGLIAVPLLSFFLPVADAVTFALIFQLLMGFLLVRIYKEVKQDILLTFLPAMVIGVLTGSLSLNFFSDDVIRLLLAVFILFYLARDWLKISQRPSGKRDPHLFGFGGGYITGMIGTGGPLYVMYFSKYIDNPRQFRATIVASFFITSLLRFPGYGLSGLLDVDIIVASFYTMPAFFISIWLGNRMHNKIPEKLFFNLIKGVLLVSACSLILKTIL
jgi:uncharacterized membrane protein YfcA